MKGRGKITAVYHIEIIGSYLDHKANTGISITITDKQYF